MNNLKPLVNNKDIWESLLEELDERIHFAHKQLEQANETQEVFRLQGEIRCLRRMKQMRDKVNG